MEFSTMVLTMYVAVEDDPANDERVIGIAVEQALLAAELGYNPWFTEHHFRGPWHSNPIQFASYIAPQIPRDRYLGFGVISVPYYHPVRLVESMNQLDQLTKGRTLYGLGSGFPGIEPLGLGLEADYHRSGQATEDMLEIMERLWDFKTGDQDYVFDTPTQKGIIKRRVTPSAYRKRRPTVIRTASRDASVVKAAQRGMPAFLGTFSAESPLRDQLRAYVERYGQIMGPVVERKPGQATAAAYAAGGDMHNLIAGTPDTVAQKVQALADLGLNHLLLRFLGEWPGATRWISESSMRLFASDVAPRFRHLPALRDPQGVDLQAAE